MPRSRTCMDCDSTHLVPGKARCLDCLRRVEVEYRNNRRAYLERSNCGECFFFDAAGSGGFCHRYPPTLDGHAAVDAAGWCGEWLPREG